ncbi:dephospho-CoA kinase [Thiomicrospira microaerophila]|uniref:dephospho-CoA kinase n=1 Tax=Thiomicrospira microaerophila TaxID=406020 RepID=UPI00200F7C20|nr:dephospho-CoA kinase [Thiomicrospira microaerophila]UQB42599.1 dephospho-CoA kinase [Thiomicrospira microaerophila]
MKSRPSQLNNQVIGVTGGIGCGKSAVCDYFADQGYPVIDTDLVAKQLVSKGQPGLVEIISLVGKGYLTAQGELDRKKLATVFFSQPQLKQQIEAVLHPMVRQAVRAQIEQLKPHHRLIFIAVPVLQQLNQPEYQIDHVLLVECDTQQQITRVQQRDQRSAEQIQQIIQQQAPPAQRLAIADSVINNNRDLAHLHTQAKAWLFKIIQDRIIP